MKFISSILLVVLVVLRAPVLGQMAEAEIIPRPQRISVSGGTFTFDKRTKLEISDEIGRRVAQRFNEQLMRNYGIKLKITDKSQKKNSVVFHTTGQDRIANPEGYILRVSPDFIYVTGSEVGQFYALQSLIQLLPTKLNQPALLTSQRIEDQPRFPYRGTHLDVARHFMPVEFVKKYIDLMSQYKFNYFHWHLTEDQGWRIEIKKYPKLTEIGSKRPETVKERNLTPYIGDGIPHGGFYTQDEIKDVVKYAKERFITVIPEIELPGHASAALAAYPQFGCKQDYQYKVQTTWGIFKEVYCPTDETFKFLEDILDETIKLFPDSPYIHIGGDEVLKDHWKESAFVQQLKQKENLKDEHEVQSYFVRRIEKFINSKGKKMIGWDEILEGGLAPNATVMSWRGMRGGIEAAKAKHDVIMTPTDYVYFDYGQGDPAYEPLNIGSYVPLEKVYSFEPVPKELTPDEAKYVIGGQANIWTEYMKTPQHVEYMAFPRMIALSEVLWSRKEDRSLADFQRRLSTHFARLDKQNVNYRIPEPIGLQNQIVGKDGKVAILLAQNVPGSKIYYGSNPDTTGKGNDLPFEVQLTLKDGQTAEFKTIVVLPTGRKSSVYAATLVRKPMLEPVTRAESKPGVNFSLWVPNNDFAQDPAPQVGESQSIALNQFAQRINLKESFAVSFDGYFKAQSDGVYEFQVDSTWDAAVSLGGKEIIDEAGTKDRSVKSAIVPLTAGLHKISIRYGHRGGDAAFRFRWGIKGQGLRQANGGEFVH